MILYTNERDRCYGYNRCSCENLTFGKAATWYATLAGFDDEKSMVEGRNKKTKQKPKLHEFSILNEVYRINVLKLKTLFCL